MRSTPRAVPGGDRGIATEDRVQWLREQGYRYLVVSRERTRHSTPRRRSSTSSHGVHLHKVLSEDAQEVRLYCFSEERAAKERGIVERFAKRFEDALTKLSEGLSKPRTQKHLDKVWQGALVGSKLKAAASPSTTTSNSTPTRPASVPPPCASSAARSPVR